MARGDLTDQQYARIEIHLPKMIPERRDERESRKKGRKGGRPRTFDPERYAAHNVVERCFCRLKQWRRVATRYDKRAQSDLAWVTLASRLIWLAS